MGPDDVTVHVKARHVTVKGKRGEVKKNFQHLAVELQKIKQNDNKRKGDFIRIRMWFGGYKQACAVNTLKSLISNMITGVTEGYRYKMRLCYSHFPINASVAKDGSSVLIKNFLGGTKVRLTQPTRSRTSLSLKDQTTLQFLSVLPAPARSARPVQRITESSWMVSMSPPRKKSSQKKSDDRSLPKD